MYDRTYMNLKAMCTLSSISKHKDSKISPFALLPKWPDIYLAQKCLPIMVLIRAHMSLLCGYSMPNEYLRSCHLSCDNPTPYRFGFMFVTCWTKFSIVPTRKDTLLFYYRVP